MRLFHSAIYVLIGSIFFACNSNLSDKDNRLPILGEKEIIDGKEVDHRIPEFSFVNQDSQIITSATFNDKVYVVDFFFTSCPTICPKMTKQMKRLHDTFLINDEIAILSHSIDTKRDSVERLKWYAESIGITSADKWHFVTGDKDEIYKIADDYFSIALENDDAPEGFDHSGRFILVDKERRVRAFADGTEPDEVDRFMKDIEKLLEEYKTE